MFKEETEQREREGRENLIKRDSWERGGRERDRERKRKERIW